MSQAVRTLSPEVITLRDARVRENHRRTPAHRRDSVMTTPPAISFGANGSQAVAPSGVKYFGTPTISGRIVTLTEATLGTARVRVRRTHPYTYVNNARTYFDSLIGSLTTQIAAPNQWSFEFGYYGSYCVVWMRQSGGGRLRIKVDGQYASLTPTSLPTSWAGLLVIDFTAAGGVAARTIEVECDLCAPAFIGVSPTDTLFFPSRPRELCIYSIGDSFWYGSNSTDPGFTSMVETIRDVTGIDDLMVDGVGSTGYLKTTGLGGNNFLNRVTANAAAIADADYVLFAGSVNDAIYTANQVQAQAALCFAAVAPKPVLAVMMASQSPVPAGQIAVRDGVAAAMAAAPNRLAFLDLTGLLVGTGYGGHTTGVGNSDVLRSSDGTHPTQAGHDILGRLIGNWINEVLP